MRSRSAAFGKRRAGPKLWLVAAITAGDIHDAIASHDRRYPAELRGGPGTEQIEQRDFDLAGSRRHVAAWDTWLLRLRISDRHPARRHPAQSWRPEPDAVHAHKRILGSGQLFDGSVHELAGLHLRRRRNGLEWLRDRIHYTVVIHRQCIAALHIRGNARLAALGGDNSAR